MGQEGKRRKADCPSGTPHSGVQGPLHSRPGQPLHSHLPPPEPPGSRQNYLWVPKQTLELCASLHRLTTLIPSNRRLLIPQDSVQSPFSSVKPSLTDHTLPQVALATHSLLPCSALYRSLRQMHTTLCWSVFLPQETRYTHEAEPGSDSPLCPHAQHRSTHRAGMNGWGRGERKDR